MSIILFCQDSFSFFYEFPPNCICIDLVFSFNMLCFSYPLQNWIWSFTKHIEKYFASLLCSALGSCIAFWQSQRRQLSEAEKIHFSSSFQSNQFCSKLQRKILFIILTGIPSHILISSKISHHGQDPIQLEPKRERWKMNCLTRQFSCKKWVHPDYFAYLQKRVL